MANRVRLVLETDPDLVIATAAMMPSGKVVYTGQDDVMRPVVEEALEGKKDRHNAFRRLMKQGWSNGYLMIDLRGSD